MLIDKQQKNDLQVTPPKYWTLEAYKSNLTFNPFMDIKSVTPLPNYLQSLRSKTLYIQFVSRS